MRAWERVTYLEHCGHCGAHLHAGDPMQTITRHGLKRKLIRCPACAEGDVPPDLPHNPVHLSVEERVAQIRMQPVQAAQASALPTRTRGALREAAREWMPFREGRDPGEDD